MFMKIANIEYNSVIKKYIVENRSKCLFVGYYNGHYNLIKFFTKDELKEEFGIEF